MAHTVLPCAPLHYSKSFTEIVPFRKCRNAETLKKYPTVSAYGRRTVRHVRVNALPTSDVIVVGAGIIGLSIARKILEDDPKTSVCVLERGSHICAEATGAGYLWMVHRDASEAGMWELAARGKQLWGEEAQKLQAAEAAQLIGYKTTGSLLLATTERDAAELRARSAHLSAAGQPATLLSAAECEALEPLLRMPAAGAALRAPADAQIDGRAATEYLLKRCAALGGRGGRFSIVFGCAVQRLTMGCCSTSVSGVATSQGEFLCEKGVVLAAGAWSADLIARSFYDNLYKDMLRPRAGHLLELPYPDGVKPLRHGVMDCAYTRHYSRNSSAGAAESDASARAPVAAASGAVPASGDASAGGVAAQDSAAAGRTQRLPRVGRLPAGLDDLTFTATTSTAGTLLLGSSRQDDDIGAEPYAPVVDAILEEAALFMPQLASHLERERASVKVRIGPRPATARSRPFIGCVPGCDGLVLAAGHEGSGLTMALSTAEIVSALLDGSPVPTYVDAFKW